MCMKIFGLCGMLPEAAGKPAVGEERPAPAVGIMFDVYSVNV